MEIDIDMEKRDKGINNRVSSVYLSIHSKSSWVTVHSMDHPSNLLSHGCQGSRVGSNLILNPALMQDIDVTIAS